MAEALGATEQNCNLTMRVFFAAAAAKLTLRCFFSGLETLQMNSGMVDEHRLAFYPLSHMYKVPEHSIEVAWAKGENGMNQ